MIDLANLSATELDDLIRHAAVIRSQMAPTFSQNPPDVMPATLNPSWNLTMGPEGAQLKMLHPQFGWLAFVIGPVQRTMLSVLLLQQCMLQPAVYEAVPIEQSLPVRH
jgi:hypothetical protein